MINGLKTYDQNQNVILDLTDRITKIIGTIIIPASVSETSGQIVEPEFLNGTPFFFTQGNQTKKSGWIDGQNLWHGFYGHNEGSFYPIAEIAAYGVEVKFENTVMTWKVKRFQFDWVKIKNEKMMIHYGIY